MRIGMRDLSLGDLDEHERFLAFDFQTLESLADLRTECRKLGVEFRQEAFVQQDKERIAGVRAHLKQMRQPIRHMNPPLQIPDSRHR